MSAELNNRAKQIINLARNYANKNNISTMGTEFLILAMYETEDSLCHFLFNEYEISHEEVIAKTEKLFILRKKSAKDNKTLASIIEAANVLAADKSISEEHLFMSILLNRNTIASKIIESLGLKIEDLIEDVKEIYDFQSGSPDELSFIRNVTKAAKNNELATFIKREEYLERMAIIINRKYKNNPLLIGNAGVGKTALVEGYAKMLLEEKSDLTILALNLTSMLAGTRYRGDFEERFDKFVKEIASKKNVIIFIDEIHTIIGAATTEGNLDVANMLKPFLARNDIKLIGATTLDEYHKTIAKDKALQRRFQPVFISEPSLAETKEILLGIKEDYEKYHQVSISKEILEYLLEQSDKKIIRKFRPDKCIDILDDVMSLNSIKKKKEVTVSDVDYAITNYLGNKIAKANYLLNYQSLEKFHWLNELDLLDDKPMLKLAYSGSNIGLDELINDCFNVFNVGFESLLDIDLSGYKEGFMLTSLVGAPPGYVGYDDEGVLSKHLLSYPTSIIVFKNFDLASNNIKAFINNLLVNGSYIDQKGRTIELYHTILIVEGIKMKGEIGFSNSVSNIEFKMFDEYIKETLVNDNLFNDKYIKALRKFDYEVSFDFGINKDNKKQVNNYLFELIHDSKDRAFEIKHSNLK